MRYELLISLKYLFSGRGRGIISVRSFLSVSGVAIGVAALISVIGVMSGFDKELKDKIAGSNAHIFVYKDGDIEDSGALESKIAGVNHVIAVSPVISGQALIKVGDYITGVLIKGVDIDKESRVTELNKSIKYGSARLYSRNASLRAEPFPQDRVLRDEVGTRSERGRCRPQS